MSTTQTVTGAVTLLYGTQGSGNSTMLIVNLDSANTVWVNESSQVQYGGPVGVPVQPGASISMTATQGLWAVCAPGVTLQIALIPNGTSYFFPASLSNLGGAKVYVQAGQPTGIIPANSIWFNTATDALETWNGTGWEIQKFSGQELILPATLLGTQLANGTLTSAQLAAAAGILGTQIASATITGGNIAANTIVADNIAANTITAAELAANIVYAGIVNGTTIEGANFIATGSSGDILVYSGTPAAGNMIASISPVSGTDSYGNEYIQGIGSYQESNGSAVILEAGSPALMGIYTGDSAQDSPGLITSSILGSGDTRSLLTEFVSPRVTGSTAYGYMFIESPTANLAGGAGLNLGTSSDYPISISMSDGSSTANAVFSLQAWYGSANRPILDLLPSGMFCSVPLIGQEPGASVGTEEVWHPCTLASGFTTGTADQAPRYMIDLFGFVHLDGTVYTSAATAAGATMFTLPDGYRPATDRRRFVGLTNASGWAAGDTTVEVATSGVVECPVACSGSGQQIVLDGISFPTN